MSFYANRQRDGMAKIIQFGKTLCRLVQAFKVVIIGKYGDKPNILALIVAIEAVCSLLPEAESDFLPIAQDDETAPSDPSELQGIDPSAPPAPDPEIT